MWFWHLMRCCFFLWSIISIKRSLRKRVIICISIEFILQRHSIQKITGCIRGIRVVWHLFGSGINTANEQSHSTTFPQYFPNLSVGLVDFENSCGSRSQMSLWFVWTLSMTLLLPVSSIQVFSNEKAHCSLDGNCCCLAPPVLLLFFVGWPNGSAWSFYKKI